MKLKGDWSSEAVYAVGDVVRNIEGSYFYLVNPCPTGAVPTDPLYWNRLEGMMAICAEMIMNIYDDKIPKNINDEAITLNTDDHEYLITVDDSGDTPELEVTQIDDSEGAES